MTTLPRIIVTLTAEQHKVVLAIAKKEHISISEVARRAIDAFTRKGQKYPIATTKHTSKKPVIAANADADDVLDDPYGLT